MDSKHADAYVSILLDPELLSVPFKLDGGTGRGQGTFFFRLLLSRLIDCRIIHIRPRQRSPICHSTPQLLNIYDYRDIIPHTIRRNASLGSPASQDQSINAGLLLSLRLQKGAIRTSTSNPNERSDVEEYGEGKDTGWRKEIELIGTVTRFVVCHS